MSMNTAAIFLFAAATAVEGMAASAIEAGFANPPAEARARTWWHWMDRNITKEGITKDLEAMKGAGRAQGAA